MRNVQAMQASSITINPCSNVRSSKGNSTVAFGGRTISPKIHQSQQAVASRSSLHFRCAHVPASDCARVLDRPAGRRVLCSLQQLRDLDGKGLKFLCTRRSRRKRRRRLMRRRLRSLVAVET